MRNEILKATGTTTHAAPCAHHLFEQQAARTPDAVAAVYADQSITYDQLNRRANRLAHHLIARGVEADTLVGLCTGRCIDMLVGILGIWKAGGAYVPVDPGYPAQRIRYMLEDSGVGAIITQESVWRAIRADDEASPEAFFMDTEHAEPLLRRYPDSNPQTPSTPRQLAYVIYTSGSTGAPKGVLIEHGSLVNLFEGLARSLDIAQFPQPYNALQNASISFDSSVKQLLHILHGGALHILPEQCRLDPQQFLAYIERNRIHCFDCTPSLIKLLLRHCRDHRIADHATCLLIGGEAIDRALWRDLAGLGNSRCYNVYGPTECTVDTTCAAIVDANATPVIGCALPHVECHVLDDNLRPVAAGAIGELFVGGAGLARGYWRRPELTAQRFIDNPFASGARLYKTGDLVRRLRNGDLEFIGRADDQVKVRGFRIELGEIEARLRAHPEVRDAAVAVRGERVEERKLIAGIVPKDTGVDCAPRESAAPDSAALLSRVETYLRAALLAYMVPSQFTVLDTLPLTPIGKVDRAALAAQHHGAAHAQPFEAPATELERAIAAIWSELLEVESISRLDHFFQLGGHSLLLMQMLSAVKQRLGLELGVRDAFDHPTLAGFAAVAQNAVAAGATARAIKRASAAEQRQVSFEEELLFRFGGHVSPPMLMTFNISGPIDVDAFQASVRRIIERHAVLRTTLRLEGEAIVQACAEFDPDCIGFEDLAASADPRRELAARIEVNAYSLNLERFCRAVLFRTGAHSHAFMLAMGHMVSDIWSFDVFLKELSALYSAAVQGRDDPLPPLPIQYCDYGASQRDWLQRGLFGPALEYWSRRLRDLPPLLPIPTDTDRAEATTYLMRTVPIAFPPELVARIGALGVELGATPYMILLAAFNVLLSRCAQRDDIVVVCPASSRSCAEVENLIGCFLNLLFLRNSVDWDETFKDLLLRVRDNVIDDYNHQNVPSLILQGMLAQQSGAFPAQLFQVALDYNPEVRDFDLPALQVADFTAQQLDLTEERPGSSFDFIWMLRETPGAISGRVSYNTSLFREATVQRMVEDFIALVDALTTDPGRVLAATPPAGGYAAGALPVPGK